jgi:patatin-like phospholipase/acyl hydrolase
MSYRVVSFDGGGIRGIVSARLLERLTRSVPALLDGIDLVAGTSTGGLIALALAAGKTPAHIVDVYRNDAEQIFDDSFLDNVRDLGRIRGADYSLKRLRRTLERELGERRLSHLTKRVLIAAFDLDNEAVGAERSWKAKFFHNFPGEDSDGGRRAVDVGLATSAAPTYFPSHLGFIDGGVVAANPSVAALAQALDPRAGNQSLDDVRLLSIGTGRNPVYIRGSKHDWGYAQWAQFLPRIFIDGVAGVADFQCRQILGARYLRIDPRLPRKIDMDDISHLEELTRIADGEDLTAAIAWIGAQFL